MRPRLTSLDNSFLRVEDANVHMHVAWASLFEPNPDRPRPTAAALRTKVAGRLTHLPRFRQRLGYATLGLGEPFWIDDPAFDVANHVTTFEDSPEAPTPAEFRALTDAALSQPLDRSRPLWHIYLAPKLDDGRVGLVCKIHHAMVDGKSAVEVALLLLDSSANPRPEAEPQWAPPPPPPSSRQLAMEAMIDDAGESLRAVRGLARAATTGGSSLAGTLKRAALSVERDMLRSAPDSHLNGPIGPKRTLVCHSARMSDIVIARRNGWATVNDVCLAAVAGALRKLAVVRGEEPKPLKAMVPVSVRDDDTERQALGNRISFAFVDMPVDLRTAKQRLEKVRADTAAFKRSGHAVGTEAVLSTLGALPGPLKDRAARMAASARMYNLTVSNIPGPVDPVYMLGAELVEAYPVVPLGTEHALAIGMFSHRDRLFFGLYADPEALPEVDQLPAALASSIAALARHPRGRQRRSSAAEVVRPPRTAVGADGA